MQPMVSPRADDEVRFLCRFQNRFVILGADGIAGGLHLIRIGGAPAKKIPPHERAESPALRIDARTRARRIELYLVRGARIEHQEVRHWTVGPSAPQQVAPLPAAGKLCAERRQRSA